MQSSEKLLRARRMEENVDSLVCSNVQSPDKPCQELTAQGLSGKGGVKGDSCQVPPLCGSQWAP